MDDKEKSTSKQNEEAQSPGQMEEGKGDADSKGSEAGGDSGEGRTGTKRGSTDS